MPSLREPCDFRTVSRPRPRSPAQLAAGLLLAHGRATMTGYNDQPSHDQVRRLLLLQFALVALGCGGDDAGGATEPCPARLPICSAFENSGRFGGYVEVTVDETSAIATVRS